MYPNFYKEDIDRTATEVETNSTSSLTQLDFE